MLILHRRKLITGAAALVAMAALPRRAYATTTALNPSDKDAGITLSNSNLTMTNSSGVGVSGARADTAIPGGKVYYEQTVTSVGLSNPAGGLSIAAAAFATLGISGGTQTGGISVIANGTITRNGSNVGFGISDQRNGTSTWGFALDPCFGLWIRSSLASTTWNAGGSADPTTGVGAISLAALGTSILFPFGTSPAAGIDPSTFNFGATAFGMTIPTGYSSVNAGSGAFSCSTGRSRLVQ